MTLILRRESNCCTITVQKQPVHLLVSTETWPRYELKGYIKYFSFIMQWMIVVVWDWPLHQCVEGTQHIWGGKNEVAMRQGERWWRVYVFYFCPAVKEKLTADPDSEIATTSLRVSLLCPVSTPIMPEHDRPFFSVVVPTCMTVCDSTCPHAHNSWLINAWCVCQTVISTPITSPLHVGLVCSCALFTLTLCVHPVQLGKMRLMIPCRAMTCSHLQCFDATLYIQMNEKKPTWVCPVCDKKAPYEHLIIDGWATHRLPVWPVEKVWG